MEVAFSESDEMAHDSTINNQTVLRWEIRDFKHYRARLDLGCTEGRVSPSFYYYIHAFISFISLVSSAFCRFTHLLKCTSNFIFNGYSDKFSSFTAFILGDFHLLLYIFRKYQECISFLGYICLCVWTRYLFHFFQDRMTFL